MNFFVQISRLLRLTVFLALFIPGGAAAIETPVGDFAAIAFNRDTHFFGSVNDGSTLAEAKALAIRNCGDRIQCEVFASGDRSLDLYTSAHAGSFCASETWNNCSDAEALYRQRVTLTVASRGVIRPDCFSANQKFGIADYSESDFVAIAVDSQTQTFGSNRGGSNRYAAESAALSDCIANAGNSENCRVLLSAKGQCIGITLVKTGHVNYLGVVTKQAISTSFAEVREQIGYGLPGAVGKIECPRNNGMRKYIGTSPTCY